MHAQADKTDWHALESKVYNEISAGHLAHAKRILCAPPGWEAHAVCLNFAA